MKAVNPHRLTTPNSLLTGGKLLGAAENIHGNHKTRYATPIGARDFDESDASGPGFQFRNVNIVSDPQLTGPDISDALGVTDT
ncbi:DUF4839 domain-containing protein [Rhodococcus qingshengii]|uniref:DUF4839 domain-containing protein n=1 Tax=Rhodococcus qingshengii TaxID=334542 RepID=UPI00187C27FE|nr:DUF4839 domain-containing protein [Rhodococcus qingshengii]